MEKSKNIRSLLACLGVAAVLTACGGKMKETSDVALKTVLADKFLIGVAVNSGQAAERDSVGAALIKKHFNSVVAENCMKSEVIHPEEGRYDFTLSDEFVRFGEENKMFIIGHTLIWHSQLPEWFCIDEKGENVEPEVLKARMREHIHTVVGRYKGRVKGWDVVNEAIETDGSYRKSLFYQILGEEFIPLAFQYAHEADPDAELYYNDYGMAHEGKRNAVVTLVKSLKEQGLRIDGVGIQGHMGMDHPNYDEFEKSIVAFGQAGVKVMITEWDMSALPTVNAGANVADTVSFNDKLNPYSVELPDSVSAVWNERMETFFRLFEKHSDVISRVTAWGLSDGNSWLNYWPIKGRKDYPLLFDRHFQPKPFVRDILEKGC